MTRWVVFEALEPAGWFGEGDDGEFAWAYGGDDGAVVDALEAMDVAVGRGGEVHEGRVEAPADEKTENAALHVSELSGVDVVPEEQATAEELSEAGIGGGSVKRVERVADAPDGATVHADEKGLFYVEGKSWIPYEGPRGGTGWKNMETGEVDYSDEPPGETQDPSPLEDDPMEEGDRVLLRYDGEVHYGEVVAETPKDVRVRDERNVWTLDRDRSEQYDGQMEILNLGEGESDAIDPRDADPNDPEELSWAFDEMMPEEAADKAVEAAREAGPGAVVEAVEQSGYSHRLMADEIQRRHGRVEVEGGAITPDPDDGDIYGFQEELYERLDTPTQQAAVGDAVNGWEGHMYRDVRTAPLIQHAMAQTGNETMPEYNRADRAAEADVDEERIEAVRKLDEFTTEKLREAFGDEITVYRGFATPGGAHAGTPSVGTAVSERMKEAKEAGEPVELEHRPVESWSLDFQTARLYASGGALIRRTVPVEDVVMSSSCGAPHPDENDTVLKHDGPTTYEPGEMLVGDEINEGPEELRAALRFVEETS